MSNTRVRTALLSLVLAALICLMVTMPAFAEVDLADGTYLVDVTLEGGSGKATIDSPTTVTVSDGAATATIVWSSPNYDYMVVAGETYHPTNTEGNSTFEIPVETLDEPLDVVGDTTAMSVPHEIDYRIIFDAANAKAVDGGTQGTLSLPVACGIASLAAVGCALYVIRKRRAQ